MDENETYPDRLTRLATLLDVLSHPARLQIVEQLARYHECPAGAIIERLPLCKSTVSQHLAKLKEVGIISCKPQGICQEYSLNDEVFEVLKSNFLDYIHRIDELKEIKVDVD